MTVHVVQEDPPRADGADEPLDLLRDDVGLVELILVRPVVNEGVPGAVGPERGGGEEGYLVERGRCDVSGPVMLREIVRLRPTLCGEIVEPVSGPEDVA